MSTDYSDAHTSTRANDALVYDYRARASLTQLPLATQDTIRTTLLTLSQKGWNLSSSLLLSVKRLRGGANDEYYGIRLRVEPEIEVVLRPGAGPQSLVVTDVLNYNALEYAVTSV